VNQRVKLGAAAGPSALCDLPVHVVGQRSLVTMGDPTGRRPECQEADPAGEGRDGPARGGSKTRLWPPGPRSGARSQSRPLPSILRRLQAAAHPSSRATSFCSTAAFWKAVPPRESQEPPGGLQAPKGRPDGHGFREEESLCRLALVGRLGLEPRTDGLKVRCSAIELTPLEPARPAPSDEAYRLKR
jgi:hypothetical protein